VRAARSWRVGRLGCASPLLTASFIPFSFLPHLPPPSSPRRQSGKKLRIGTRRPEDQGLPPDRDSLRHAKCASLRWSQSPGFRSWPPSVRRSPWKVSGRVVFSMHCAQPASGGDRKAARLPSDILKREMTSASFGLAQASRPAARFLPSLPPCDSEWVRRIDLSMSAARSRSD